MYCSVYFSPQFALLAGYLSSFILLLRGIDMRVLQCYAVQLVGNTGSVKRMVVSFYLVHAKKQNQVLKVSKLYSFLQSRESEKGVND